MNGKSRLLIAVAVAAVLVFVVATVVRCTVVHADNPLEQIVPAAPGQDEDSSDGGEQTYAEPADVLALLKSSAWTAEGGKASIEFKDGRYVETDGTATKMTAFDVDSVSDEGDQSAVRLKIERADGTAKDSVVLVRKDASGTPAVSSDDFQLAKTYAQGKANSGPVSIEGVNAEYRELLGGSTDKLQSAITDYAHGHAPSATAASWTQELVIDYKSNVASSNFRLNDASSTMLTVSYDMGAHSFTVMG